MPAESVDPGRYNALLAEWLLATVVASGETWWLVIDDLAAAPPGDNIVDFVGRLAKLAAREPGPIRVVLLGWDALLSADIEPHVMREQLGEIAVVDVREFLSEALARAGQTVPDAELERMARDLYLGAKPGDLRGLAFRVAELYDRITSSGPSPHRVPRVTSDDLALARAWEQQSVWSQVASRLKRDLQRSASAC